MFPFYLLRVAAKYTKKVFSNNVGVFALRTQPLITSKITRGIETAVFKVPMTFNFKVKKVAVSQKELNFFLLSCSGTMEPKKLDLQTKCQFPLLSGVNPCLVVQSFKHVPTQVYKLSCGNINFTIIVNTSKTTKKMLKKYYSTFCLHSCIIEISLCLSFSKMIFTI